MATADPKHITHTLEKLTKCQIELLQGYVRSEKRDSQVLRIVSGTAWVSIDGEDIILNSGEEFKLSHGKHQAVVSAAGDKPLIYQFGECEE